MGRVLPWEEVLVGLKRGVGHTSQIPHDGPCGSHQGLYGIWAALSTLRGGFCRWGAPGFPLGQFPFGFTSDESCSQDWAQVLKTSG